jgi:hypothetical protein
VEAVGVAANPLSLVDRAKALKVSKRHIVQDPWVVFDKGSFSDADFDTAIARATGAGFLVACSNEAFELWYVLHFEYRNTAMTRDEYKHCIENHLRNNGLENFNYLKNDKGMRLRLERYVQAALANAKRLLEAHNGALTATTNPATKVHLLVERLLTLANRWQERERQGHIA